MAYGTADEFTRMSTFPADAARRLEAAVPGFVATRLGFHSAVIDASLSKRYDAPFKPDLTGQYPLILVSWVYTLTAPDCWLKLGRAATDEDVQQSIADATAVRVQIGAASDADKGLYQLPLRQGETVSGMRRPTIAYYSETSPFVGRRRQAVIGRSEDVIGIGNYRPRRGP